jgi:hypothetical protein
MTILKTEVEQRIIYRCHCDVCGKEWTSYDKKPVACRFCKSYKWNKNEE